MCGVHLSQCPHSVFAQTRIVASYLVAELGREDVIVWPQSLCAQTSVYDFLLLETVNEETVYARWFREVNKEAVVGTIAVFLAILIRLFYDGLVYLGYE